jgi:hypothetical protein
VTFETHSNLCRISEYAFSRCSSLSSIRIPSSVQELRGYCFSECRSLRTVTFEDGSQVSRIDHSAFSGCSSLQQAPVARR